MKRLLHIIVSCLILTGCSNKTNNEFDVIQSQAARELEADSVVLANKVRAAYPLDKNSTWQAVYEDFDCSGLPELFSVVIGDSVVSMRMTTVDTIVTICSAAGKFGGVADIKNYVSEDGGYIFVNTTNSQCIILHHYKGLTKSLDLVNNFESTDICAINPLTVGRIEKDVVYVDFDCHDAERKDSIMRGCTTYEDVPFVIENGKIKECIGVEQVDISHYYGVNKVMNKINEIGGRYTYSVKTEIKGKETMFYVNFEVDKSDHIEYYYIRCKSQFHYLLPENGKTESMTVYPGNRKSSFLELMRKNAL